MPSAEFQQLFQATGPTVTTITAPMQTALTSPGTPPPTLRRHQPRRRTGDAGDDVVDNEHPRRQRRHVDDDDVVVVVDEICRWLQFLDEEAAQDESLYVSNPKGEIEEEEDEGGWK